MKIEGWTILFHPIFEKQRQQLIDRVKQLKSNLSDVDYVKHPQVKLFKALTIAIEQKIPENPLASYFALKKPLDRYSRLTGFTSWAGDPPRRPLKKMGLPPRYRLFFKVFKEEKVIIILWLGFPRKEGDKKDCYAVFRKMLKQGQFPSSLKDIIDN